MTSDRRARSPAHQRVGEPRTDAALREGMRELAGGCIPTDSQVVQESTQVTHVGVYGVLAHPPAHTQVFTPLIPHALTHAFILRCRSPACGTTRASS